MDFAILQTSSLKAENGRLFVGFFTLGTELSRFTEAESAEKAPPASRSMTQAGHSLDSTSTNTLPKSLITQANHDGHY